MEKSRIQITRQDQGETLSTSKEEEVKSKNKDGQEKRIKQDRDVRGVAIPINLLLSNFYDSGQLFKSYVFDFWPLCIDILNLPPTLRGKVDSVGNVKRYLTQRENFRARYSHHFKEIVENMIIDGVDSIKS